MVVINSMPEDVSTHHVVRWLHAWGVQLHVLEDEPVTVNIQGSGAPLLGIDGYPPIPVDKTLGYWFRRGSLNTQRRAAADQPEEFGSMLFNNGREEATVSRGYLDRRLRATRCLDSFLSANVNKLVVNDLAREHGLHVPPYILSSSKEEIASFLDQHGRAIVKPYTPAFLAISEAVRSLTQEITLGDLMRLDGPIGMSFVQKMVPKAFEVRSFYLLGTFYSTAIFSQGNEKTRLDFRNYDNDLPNRQIPFTLPAATADAARALIERIGLGSCSLDLICDEQSDLHFLEINPVGQFGPVSYWGNHGLEKKIATYLKG